MTQFQKLGAERSAEGSFLDCIKYYIIVGFLKEQEKLTEKIRLINVSDACLSRNRGFSERTSPVLSSSQEILLFLGFYNSLSNWPNILADSIGRQSRKPKDSSTMSRSRLKRQDDARGAKIYGDCIYSSRSKCLSACMYDYTLLYE